MQVTVSRPFWLGSHLWVRAGQYTDPAWEFSSFAMAHATVDAPGTPLTDPGQSSYHALPPPHSKPPHA